jgi:mono/diheme cytochrome c family protein
MAEKTCFGCHSLEKQGGGGSVGPALDRDEMVARIQARLNSQEYRDTVVEVEAMDSEPFVSYRQARQEVAAAKDLEQVRLWIKYHLLEPRFDNPNSAMPNLALTDAEADLITDYLLEGEGGGGNRARQNILTSRAGIMYMSAAFGGGLAVALGGVFLIQWLKKMGRKTPFSG